MPNSSPKGRRKQSKSTAPASGAVGGPSTAHGIGYQVDYAIWRSLDLISRALAVPHKNWTIRMEPRVVEGEEPTCWDVGINSPDALFELKLNPTRGDILDWLTHVSVAAPSLPSRAFSFVYSKGRGTLLATLSGVLRVAIGAAGDANEFQRQLDSEQVREAHVILSGLGTNAFVALQRMKLEQVPEDVLKRETEVLARCLSGELGGKRLTDFLFRKFHQAMPQRRTLQVRDIIAEARAEGIELQPLPTVDQADLSSAAAASLFVLQTCPVSVPSEVLAMAMSCSVADLAEQLGPVEKENVVALQGGCWSIRPLAAKLTPPGSMDLLARVLEALVCYILRHKHDSSDLNQIRNAVALARVCVDLRPKVVATVSKRLNTLLKRMGDKHLVYEVAELSIRAARHTEFRTDTECEGEAHALICGRSWVLQRIGHLAEARAAAQESLELGENIQWSRNAPFCKKCIGRLCRMEAEAATDIVQRKALLAESVACLQEAVKLFSSLGADEFGPEIGDCYSLLGRTYLYAKQYPQASDSVRKAFRLITDITGKDYLDLEILDGDLEAAQNRRRAAADRYDGALSRHHASEPELTEMRARAYLRRGLNRVALDQRLAAVQDFQRAGEIWRALDEPVGASQAEWEEIRISGWLLDNEIRLLEKEPRSEVRVAAYRAHKNRLAVQPVGRRARRTEQGPVYWDQHIRDARKQVALEVRHW
jgi:tetratricopeptide (TPR) repeat protein